MFAGNYNGFRIFDVSKPKSPKLIKDVFCRGQQGDVSIWATRSSSRSTRC